MSRTFLVAAASLVCMLLSTSASALRVVSQLEGDYELGLADVQLFPSNAAGYLIFTPCPSCETTSLTVSADTAYLVDRAAVPLADFLKAVEGFKRSTSGKTNVFIFYDKNSKHVNRVVLDHVGG
jgi:hypothetical protein